MPFPATRLDITFLARETGIALGTRRTAVDPPFAWALSERVDVAIKANYDHRMVTTIHDQLMRMALPDTPSPIGETLGVAWDLPAEPVSGSQP